MTCPRCGLINPDFAQRCDCGFDFTAKAAEASYLVASSRQMITVPQKARLSWAGAVAIAIGCMLCIATALVWSKGLITAEVLGYAGAGIVGLGLIAYAIAGRRSKRNWNRFSFWFVVLCAFRLGLELNSSGSKSTIPAQPRSNREGLYVGEWQNLAEYKNSAFSIYKAGDMYTVEIHSTDQGVEKLSGTFRDGRLRVSTPSGESSIVYIDATDHLVAFGSEYQRRSKYERLW